MRLSPMVHLGRWILVVSLHAPLSVFNAQRCCYFGPIDHVPLCVQTRTMTRRRSRTPGGELAKSSCLTFVLLVAYRSPFDTERRTLDQPVLQERILSWCKGNDPWSLAPGHRCPGTAPGRSRPRRAKRLPRDLLACTRQPTQPHISLTAPHRTELYSLSMTHLQVRVTISRTIGCQSSCGAPTFRKYALWVARLHHLSTNFRDSRP